MGCEVVVDIEASKERVWEALMDIGAWPKWTTSLKSVTRFDDGPLTIGSRARAAQAKLGTLTWTVTELSPGHSFAWEAKRPGLKLHAGHEVTSKDDGTATLRLTVEQTGPIGRLLGPLTKEWVRRAVELEARGHKRRAESSA